MPFSTFRLPNDFWIFLASIIILHTEVPQIEPSDVEVNAFLPKTAKISFQMDGKLPEISIFREKFWKVEN